MYLVKPHTFYKNWMEDYVQYEIHEFNNEKQTWKQLMWKSIHNEDEKMSINVQDGQRLEISGGELDIVEYHAN